MRSQWLSIPLAGLLTLGVEVVAAAQRQPSNLVELTGRVVELYSPRLLGVRELDGEREIFVLAPRALSSSLTGATVRIRGTLRRLTAAELQQATPPDPAGRQLRIRLSDRAVLVATSLVAALEGPAPAEVSYPTAPATPPTTPPAPAAARTVPSPFAVRASVLVSHLDGFAGQNVRLLNARVVGLLAPNAFLVEPATEYLKHMGTRDRIVVLIQNGELSVPADLIVGEVVVIEGIARTLLGIQVTREVPWPTRLEKETIKRLEVRAAILASSVQTAEGTELTNRRAGGPGQF